MLETKHNIHENFIAKKVHCPIDKVEIAIKRCNG